MELFAQLLVNGIYIGSVYALYGLSFATIFAPTRIWHFAQGGVYTLGAYAVYSLNVMAGLPVGVAAVGAAMFLAAAGALCERALYAPLVRRGASHMVVVMGSLGLFVVIENGLDLAFGPSGRSLDFQMPPPFFVGGVIVSPPQIAAPLISLAIILGYGWLLFRTRFGRDLRACITNAELLEINGVSTRRLRTLAFALGSALLPVAATLLLIGGSGVSPTIGITAVLTGAMAMFLGGVDAPLGAAAAGFLIGILENLSVFAVPTEWQVAVTYGLLLLLIMARPTGLFGRAVAKASV